MTRKLLKRESAKRDIIDLAGYIAQDNLDAAERFITAAEGAFQFLLQTPGAGARREYLNPALSGLRMWPIRGFKKYLVFYREGPETLEIIRVLHNARDIETIFQTDEGM
ncbi:MAG: type II toxin-antitoxin system RelE/ParE family toxin [Candidatus Hydrogenedentes bacterium]|nr:type II toxin-antitoxin system RelE/ParE family toxin [Candidatus Hydrogenedentota bacterium]